MDAAAVGEYSAETDDFAHMSYDPRFATFADTSVAVQPFSHSLRVNLPSSKAQIIGFPGPCAVRSLKPVGCTRNSFVFVIESE